MDRLARVLDALTNALFFTWLVAQGAAWLGIAVDPLALRALDVAYVVAVPYWVGRRLPPRRLTG